MSAGDLATLLAVLVVAAFVYGYVRSAPDRQEWRKRRQEELRAARKRARVRVGEDGGE